ncbi:MAG TPA: hypothetical protein VNL70_00660 [Tepidisphaeraceae bacterium]|nr:hypothetical protein [Tepidisphaeraceae bacterium]
MRWLLHGTLSGAVGPALQRHGHVANVPAELGIDPNLPPGELLRLAHQKQLDIITADADLANAPFASRIGFGRSIVFLQLKGDQVEQDDAIDRLFQRYKRLTPGRLYTVTATRVKVRQLPPAR